MKRPIPADVAARACLMAAVLLTGVAAVIVVRRFLPLMFVMAILSGIPATLFWLARFGHRLKPSDVHGKARWCDQREAARAGLFQPQGLFLGRWALGGGLRVATVQLFTLPLEQSASAVRLFLQAFDRKA